ncbi:MAG: DUF3846 domain-containing protein [Clostridia bacterium]|nr:DUF3846 domain-containing protein [Clostridia bacterium]
MKKKLNTIVFKEPNKDPVVMQIENSLEAEQKLIEGYIQAVNVEENVCIICDEEGVLKCKKPNIQHKIYGTLVGNIFVIGTNIRTGEFISLTEGQVEKYIKELKDMAIGNTINIYENYKEMREQQQKEYDQIPKMFAFDDEQFKSGLKKLGLTENKKNNIVPIGFGGFIRTQDIKQYNDMQNRFMKEFQHSIMADKSGEKFIKGMFLEEMRNHEYSYTNDLEPVLNSLGLTMQTINDFDNLKHGFELAKKECLSNCNESEQEDEEEFE